MIPIKYPKLKEEQDARVKILKSDYQRIKALHKNGIAIRAIAREYEVDKRAIQFILFPERLKKNIILRHLRGGSKAYYDREKHKEAMRKHRKRKSTLQKKQWSAWRVGEREKYKK